MSARPELLIWNRLLTTACALALRNAGARADRCSQRLYVQGLIAKIPRTRRLRGTNSGRHAMDTSLYLREHHFPNVYTGVVH